MEFKEKFPVIVKTLIDYDPVTPLTWMYLKETLQKRHV